MGKFEKIPRERRSEILRYCLENYPTPGEQFMAFRVLMMREIEFEPELEGIYKRLLEMPQETPLERLKRNIALLEFYHVMNVFYDGALTLQEAKHILNKLRR